MNLIIIYIFLFFIIFLILGIKFDVANKKYIIGFFITLVLLIGGIFSGILPQYVGKCGESAWYTMDVMKTVKIYGKGQVSLNKNDNLFGNEPLEEYLKKTKKIIIGKKIEEISDCAFTNYVNVENVFIPNNVGHIGKYAFYNCSNLNKVNIPDGITVIDYGTFEYCTDLKQIELSNNVDMIANEAFAYSGLEDITIPKNAKISNISGIKGCNSFIGCKNLHTVNVADGCVNYTVKDNILYSINNEDGDVLILYPAGREDEELAIIDNDVMVGKYAFSYCDNLKKIILNVDVLNPKAIYDCNKLEEVVVECRIASDDYITNCDNIVENIINFIQ